ncbi:MAG: hypothetical protein IPI73_25975 [Betaproteobacteria bacterium]|nr:hypothetical protein [Betaproteobacteria bacterium]
MTREGVPFVVAFNTSDLAHRRGLSFDLEKMAQAIGAPVIAIAAQAAGGSTSRPRRSRQPALRRRAARLTTPGRAVVSAAEPEFWAENVVSERQVPAVRTRGGAAATRQS